MDKTNLKRTIIAFITIAAIGWKIVRNTAGKA